MNPTVYQIITDRILDQLRRGVVPWHQPWRTNGVGPTNLVSGKPYRGCNVWLLSSTGYSTPYWVTYKQAQELGGNVRRGERAFPVILWKFLDSKPGTTPDDTGSDSPDKIPLLRYYSVFNVAQCDGLANRVPIVDLVAHEPISEAQAIVDGMPKRPEINHGGNVAVYRPLQDRVEMPEIGAFSRVEDYYNVLFHELTHSTGHGSRLNRKGLTGSEGDWQAFGSKSYSKEELVAEMGAAFLSGECGIMERTVDNSAAYIANWLHKLADDPRMVVHAAAQAQRAADFIVGRLEQNGTEVGSKPSSE